MVRVLEKTLGHMYNYLFIIQVYSQINDCLQTNFYNFLIMEGYLISDNYMGLLLTVESHILCVINIEDLVTEFAKMKARKVSLL